MVLTRFGILPLNVYLHFLPLERQKSILSVEKYFLIVMATEFHTLPEAVQLEMNCIKFQIFRG